MTKNNPILLFDMGMLKIMKHPPKHMVHYSYFNSHNLLKHDNPKGRGVNVIPKDKTKHTTLAYKLAKHRLITVIANSFKPDSKH